MERYGSCGEWLRQRRRALDFTQAELGQCVGYSVLALRKIEADERRPSRQMVELLAPCLQVPSDERRASVKRARGVDRVERLGEPLARLAVAQPRSALSSPHSKVPIPPCAAGWTGA